MILSAFVANKYISVISVLKIQIFNKLRET